MEELDALRDEVNTLKRSHRLETVGFGTHLATESEKLGNPKSSSSSNSETLEDEIMGLQNESKSCPETYHLKVRREYLGHYSKIMDIDWSPDGLHFASVALDGKLMVWDAESSLKKRSIKLDTQFINACSWDKNQGKLVATGGFDNVITLHLIDLESQPVDASQNIPPISKLDGHEACITEIEFLKNDTSLASTSADGTLRLWDSITAKCIYCTDAHLGEASTLAISKEGNIGVNVIATGGSDAGVCIHDIRTQSQGRLPLGGILKKFPGHMEEVTAVRWIPNGTGHGLISACVDGSVRIWDLRAGAFLQALSYRGNKTNNQVRIESMNSLNTATVSASGRYIFAGAEDGCIVQWDLLKLKCTSSHAYDPNLYCEPCHEEPVSKLRIHPNGECLLSSGHDSLIRLWA